MLVQKSMIGKKLVFRLTNRPKDIGNVKIKGMELEMVMPATKDQREKPMRGSCGSLLEIKD